MTNVDGRGSRAATAASLSGTIRLPKIGGVTGRWSDVTLGITWKEARRPVYKASQSDDGRRKCMTVERLYQGAPASNSKVIRAGDKLLSIDTDGATNSMIGSSVSDIVCIMEQLGDRQDIKLEFLRAPDTCPFNHTLADKSANRNRNSYTVVLSAAPKKAEPGRNVELAVGGGSSAGGRVPTASRSGSRPGSRSGPPAAKRPGTRDSRPVSRSGETAAPAASASASAGGLHAPRPPSSGSATRPASRPATSSRPKTSSWTVSEDPEDPRSTRPINATRFERLVFAVNKRLKDAELLHLLSDSYLIDRPRSPDAQGRHVMVGAAGLSLRACYRLSLWWSPDQQMQIRNMVRELASRGDSSRVQDVLDIVASHLDVAQVQFTRRQEKEEAERHRAAAKIQSIHRGKSVRQAARQPADTSSGADVEVMSSPAQSPIAADGEETAFANRPSVVTWVSPTSPATSPRGRQSETSAYTSLPSVVSWQDAQQMLQTLLPEDAEQDEAVLEQLCADAVFLVDEVAEEAKTKVERMLDMLLEHVQTHPDQPLDQDVVVAKLMGEHVDMKEADVRALLFRALSDLAHVDASDAGGKDSFRRQASAVRKAAEADNAQTVRQAFGDQPSVVTWATSPLHQRRGPEAAEGGVAVAGTHVVLHAPPQEEWSSKPSVVSWVSSPLASPMARAQPAKDQTDAQLPATEEWSSKPSVVSWVSSPLASPMGRADRTEKAAEEMAASGARAEGGGEAEGGVGAGETEQVSAPAAAPPAGEVAEAGGVSQGGDGAEVLHEAGGEAETVSHTGPVSPAVHALDGQGGGGEQAAAVIAGRDAGGEGGDGGGEGLDMPALQTAADAAVQEDAAR